MLTMVALFYKLTWSDGKCQQRSNLQKWIAVINTPRTDTHRIYAMHTLIMTFTFADLTAVDICHPTYWNSLLLQNPISDAQRMQFI